MTGRTFSNALQNLCRSLFVAAGLVGCLLLAAACGQNGDALVVSGRIEIDQSHIGSKVGGRVWKINCDEGDEVTSGTVVIELDRAQLEAELARAQANASQAKAQLDLLLAGTRAEDIRRAEGVVQAGQAELQLRRKGFRAEEVKQAEEQVKSAQSAYDLEKKDLERDESLAAAGTINRQQLDSQRSQYERAEADLRSAQQQLRLMRSGSRPEEIATAEAQLAQAQADLERLRNGPRPEEIAAARAALASAEASVALIRTQLDETRIVAPEDSMIETLNLKVGDLVQAGQAAAVVDLKRGPYVRCYVPEVDLGRVRPKMPVTVTVDAYPGEEFPAVVRRVATVAEFTPRNVQTPERRSELVFEMKVDITAKAEKLRAGMYADVHIPKASGQ